MKKKILILAVVALCFAISASESFAYYTYKEKVHNVITSGGIDIEINESMRLPDGSYTDFPEEGIKNAEPGATYSKIVKVENVGEHPAWIRAKLEYEILKPNGDPLPIVKYIGGDGFEVVSIDVLDGWIDGGDGYYYYTEPLEAGETTSSLIEHVKFDYRMDNAYQGSTTNIIIYAQGVQTANNGETVMDALGWPADAIKGE
ncbi:MAG: hypothetical protein E7672_02560 [Ruminococcaceae bacterium]|nr:hypothetical protein [Oscillospiraceae bacterium]